MGFADLLPVVHVRREDSHADDILGRCADGREFAFGALHCRRRDRGPRNVQQVVRGTGALSDLRGSIDRTPGALRRIARRSLGEECGLVSAARQPMGTGPQASRAGAPGSKPSRGVSLHSRPTQSIDRMASGRLRAYPIHEERRAPPRSPFSRATVQGRSSALAPNSITVAIKAMRVRRENPEIPVGDVRTIQVRRRRGYAYIGIGRVAIPRRRGRRG